MNNRSDKLKDLLKSTDMSWEEIMLFLTGTGIIDDKNQLRTFTKIIQIANSNGYLQALDFASKDFKERYGDNNEVL
jgi:hypothetical protein